VESLAALPLDEQIMAADSRIQQLILEPVDLSHDSMFAALLLRLSEGDYILALAMEHMISDASSRRILLHDVLTAYSQISNGTPLSLPPIALQIGDYAFRQRAAQPSWSARHLGYWEQRLAGCSRVSFPRGVGAPAGAEPRWISVPFTIDKNLKESFAEWCRLRRTTLVMGVFAAYAALVLRWCDVKDCLIRYQSDGRSLPEVENTIGFFASTLYLRIQVGDEESFNDLVDRVTREYCDAYEHSDSSFLEAQVPARDFFRNTSFNWVARGVTGVSPHSPGAANAITCSPFAFNNPVLQHIRVDSEPGVLLHDTDDGVRGYVHFLANKHSVADMERLANGFLLIIREVMISPERRMSDLSLIERN
jgi:hypothetical protein